MVHGYKTFDPDVDVAGVVMNRVAGAAHAEWLRQAMASAPSTADVAVPAPALRAVTVCGGGCNPR
jgi:cobyrinic acid a,c-diamide synthase